MTALLSEAQYRRWTSDQTHDWADPDVQAALDDALADIEAYTDRHFEQATRTESLRIFYKPMGSWQYLGYFVVPSAPPVASVSDPANAQILMGGTVLAGISPPSVFSSGPWGQDYADYATVTYVGGFTSATLPEPVGRIIATVASQRLNPNAALARLPAGIAAVRQGDMQVMFPRQSGYLGAGILDRGMRLALRPWRRAVL